MEKILLLTAVGAGSAGCALANRLTADGSNNVLLLEAGGLEDAAVQVPLFSALLQRTDIDWDYTSERQHNASLSVDDQINRFPRGKVFGGSSSINHIIYARGNRKDYDNWVSRYGAEGWSFNDVLPDFISIETSYLGIDNGYHGDSGEVPVSFPSSHTKASDLFLEAGRELGYSNDDYNGPNQTRMNAVGVEYKRYLGTHTVRARKEVILCAGAIASAQLLMLSGIGPRDHLESLAIYDNYYKKKQGDNVLMIVPVLLRPKSSGYIRLKSADPEEYPIIEPNFFADSSDLDTMIEGVTEPSCCKYFGIQLLCTLILSGSKIAAQTLTTQAMKNGNVTIWDVALPACESAGPLWSEPYLRCFVQHTSLSGWHPCCTAPMGTHSQAVLDPRLRVLGGVKKLRVVDASSMPYLTAGNLNSPLMMMGHRAAAMIMEDNSQ
ncbi:glucose dehydrogenase [FAD, quinone] [Rhipicephalus sanguineus]|uniref:glucose dehydrogenase [FAD, quinone] n=1 Tax=Rhipicephalus sanguineus TaxID=34632 RepID=UPI0018947FC3|nr:glucose dehydrogenase [FAD, quinone] [Rhipicephalus sanguineus]